MQVSPIFVVSSSAISGYGLSGNEGGGRIRGNNLTAGKLSAIYDRAVGRNCIFPLLADSAHRTPYVVISQIFSLFVVFVLYSFEIAIIQFTIVSFPVIRRGNLFHVVYSGYSPCMVKHKKNITSVCFS